MAVNLPLDVLVLDEARTWLEAMRRESGVPAGKIVIELTESQPVAALPGLTSAAIELREWGYGLAIDDVGPDMRDHLPLVGLPFTALKLDRALVRAATEGSAAAFLAEVMAAARASGWLVIAEGVEDEVTWAAMAAQGIDQIQGFLVSYPLSPEGVVAWHARQMAARLA